MDEETDALLDRLAVEMHASRSQVVREGIRELRRARARAARRLEP